MRGATALGGVLAGSGAAEPAVRSGCDGTAADTPDIDKLFKAALRAADPAAQLILRLPHARGCYPRRCEKPTSEQERKAHVSAEQISGRLKT